MHDDCLFKGKCDIECKSACMRYYEMEFMVSNSNIPKNKLKNLVLVPDDCDMEAFVELSNIRDNIKEFVDDGKDLYLHSQQFGNGKTTWSIKLMLSYFSEVWVGNGFKVRGLFINIPTFINKSKEVISREDKKFDELKYLIPRVDLVVWDDIGSLGLSNFDHANLLAYIDQRSLCGKSNIYTGNLGYDDLVKNLGNRLGSRVWNNSTVEIELKGGDKR